MKESLRDLLTVAYWAISLVDKMAVWTVATMVFSLAVSSAADVVDEMVVNQVSWMELYMVAWKGNILVLLLAALSAGELDMKRAVLKASSTVVRKEFAQVDVLVDPLADVKVLQVAEEMDSYLAA